MSTQPDPKAGSPSATPPASAQVPETNDTQETRSVEVEVEVPGTPAEVWAAIASGPGITAWFVPATVAEELGGRVTLNFGPGMDETAEVIAWEPPHRFAYLAPGGTGRDLACEFLVEARDGGTCVVRLVNSGFGTGAEWDDDVRGMDAGWQLFLANLRLYLTYFPGQRCTSILVNGTAAAPRPQAWLELTGALGLPIADIGLGERITANGADVPPLAGVVERVTDNMLTLRLDSPATGIAFVAAEGWGERAATSVYAYLFGPGSAQAAERDEPRWRTWMAKHFPEPLHQGGEVEG